MVDADYSEIILKMPTCAFLLLVSRIERGANLREEINYYVKHGEITWAYRDRL